MTTIKAQFSAKDQSNLETALVFGIKHTSTKQLAGNSLFVSWICETDNYEQALSDCMESVNMDEMDSLGVDVVTIG